MTNFDYLFVFSVRFPFEKGSCDQQKNVSPTCRNYSLFWVSIHNLYKQGISINNLFVFCQTYSSQKTIKLVNNNCDCENMCLFYGVMWTIIPEKINRQKVMSFPRRSMTIIYYETLETKPEAVYGGELLAGYAATFSHLVNLNRLPTWICLLVNYSVSFRQILTKSHELKKGFRCLFQKDDDNAKALIKWADMLLKL